MWYVSHRYMIYTICISYIWSRRMVEDQITEWFFIRSKITFNPFTWLDKDEGRRWADLVLIRQFFRFIHIDTDEKYGGKFFRQSIELWRDPLTWSTPWGMKVQDKKNVWGAGHQIIQLFHFSHSFQWHLFVWNDRTFHTQKIRKDVFGLDQNGLESVWNWSKIVRVLKVMNAHWRTKIGLLFGQTKFHEN